MKNLSNKSAGISLVALVVTIIVLIILTATVIITTMEGGIIDKAKEAVNKSNKATEIEVLTMARLSAMDENTLGYNIDDNLPEGWSGEDGVYTSPTGNIYVIEENGSIVALEDSINPTALPEATVLDITSEDDIRDAILDSHSPQVWNIKNDFTMTDKILVEKEGLKLTINGNGHTITGSDDTSSTFAPYMFSFKSKRTAGSSFVINNLNVVSGSHFRTVMQFQRIAGSDKVNVRLNNVKIDHTKGTSQNDKYGAAIVCNSAEIKVQNKLSIISGERAWAAIDLDNSNGNAILTFASNANISFTDNRSQTKKDNEPFIGFSNENPSNQISFINQSSYTMTHVTNYGENSKEGYNLAN